MLSVAQPSRCRRALFKTSSTPDGETGQEGPVATGATRLQTEPAGIRAQDGCAAGSERLRPHPSRLLLQINSRNLVNLRRKLGARSSRTAKAALTGLRPRASQREGCAGGDGGAPFP